MEQAQTHIREPRPEKVAQVTMLKEKFSAAKSAFLTDFTGLSVEEITELRRKLRERNSEYLVVKNTLARLSAKEAGVEDILPYLEGPIAIAFSYDDPAAPARVIAEFVKSHSKPNPKVKACLIEGDVLPGEEAEEIAKWPTREELIARLVGQLNAPIYGLVNALADVSRRLVYVLNAIKEKKEGQA
ncbi:MAG: 50S ribosomal protein L10 [candidate division KSB1 bacterium]|nr:50S ribosomal protein L10 [candidate division KSB1 bacterium]MDQ7063793.1 50S ribosomal protein L10 [candidate division KSB1 bacterium]